MLKRVNERIVPKGITIAEANFPNPFAQTLEYAAPARGCWNIVHTGMLVPESHEIFVCPAGCLRGVVLTAAEMGVMHRFSTVEVRENNLLDGDMEELIIEGVTDILNKVPKHPPAVLLFTSCVHHFVGCDLKLIYDELTSRFPHIQFTDCYMNPIMRKSGLTPDQLVRKGIFALLKKRPIDPKTVMILNCDQPMMEDSDLIRWLKGNGYTVHELTACGSYEEFQAMAGCAHYISCNSAANAAGAQMEQTLGGMLSYLPLSFDYDEIDRSYAEVADVLGIPATESGRQQCEKSLKELFALVGDTPIAIDYTACARPLSLAKLLLAHGFQVKRVYLDVIAGEEKGDFDALKGLYPHLELWPTTHPMMRFAASQGDSGWLAIGQKAAYFTNTNRFVNLVSGGGIHGYQAIVHLCALTKDAFCNEKDMRSLIQIKGKGCEICL